MFRADIGGGSKTISFELYSSCEVCSHVDTLDLPNIRRHPAWHGVILVAVYDELETSTTVEYLSFSAAVAQASCCSRGIPPPTTLPTRCHCQSQHGRAPGGPEQQDFSGLCRRRDTNSCDHSNHPPEQASRRHPWTFLNDRYRQW